MKPGNIWYNYQTSTGSPLVTARKSQYVVRASQKRLFTNQKTLPVIKEGQEGRRAGGDPMATRAGRVHAFTLITFTYIFTPQLFKVGVVP